MKRPSRDPRKKDAAVKASAFEEAASGAMPTRGRKTLEEKLKEMARGNAEKVIDITADDIAATVALISGFPSSA